MKPTWLLFFCVFIAFSNHGVGQVSVGVRGGMNLSDQTFINAGNYPDFFNDAKVRLGFVGGFFVRWKASKYFGVQSDVLYSTQGSRVDHTIAYKGPLPGVAGRSTRIITEFGLHYINIPILGQVQPFPHFMLELGPQFSFLTKSTGGFSNDNRIRKTDFGMTVGAAFVIEDVSAGGRYTLGLLQIVDNSDNYYDYYYADHNRNFELYVAYRLAVWKKKRRSQEGTPP